MAQLTFQNHAIVSTPVYDENTGKWKSSVSVSWPEIDNPRGVRFLTTSPELFLRFEDAEQAGLEVGQNWVGTITRKPPEAKPAKQKASIPKALV